MLKPLHGRFRWALAAGAVLLALACGTPSLPDGPAAPGTYLVSLDERAGGRQRTYRIHIPAGLGSAALAPLFVALHGGVSSAKTLERRAGLNAAAARHRFLVVYPNGEGALGLFRHWNAGHCCATAMREGRDDVGFLRRVIEDVGRRLPFDAERIYVAGFSNGGMLAWRFAAEHADLVAGVAPIAATVAGALETDDAGAELPTPARNVPLILFRGREDARVPAEHVDASLAFWAAGSGCRPDPEERRLREGRIRIREWQSCDPGGAMAAYELAGWGHRWPGPYFSNGRDDALRGFDGVEVLWSFFEANRPVSRVARGGAAHAEADQASERATSTVRSTSASR